jgi:hypothetical protein
MSTGPAAGAGMTPVQATTLALRAAMEAGVVGALAYWGARTGTSTAGSALLAVAAPAVGFGVWGALDFGFAGRWAEPLRLVEELLISGLAATALYLAGQQALGIALAGLSVGYHALVYAAGGRLLDRRAEGSRRA